MGVLRHWMVNRRGRPALVLQLEASEMRLPGTLRDLQSGMLKVVRKTCRALVVVDLSPVEQWNTDALAVLLRIHKQVRFRGGTLRVTGLGKHLEMGYKLCMLDRIMPLSDTIDQALEADWKEAGQDAAVG